MKRYCSRCGSPINVRVNVPSRCPACQADIGYEPRWMVNVSAVVGIAVSMGICALLFLVLQAPKVLVIALFFVLMLVSIGGLSAILYRMGVLSCPDVVAEKPENPTSPARPETLEEQLARIPRFVPGERDRGRAKRSGAGDDAANRLRLVYERVNAGDYARIAELEAFASKIVQEHLETLVGTDQAIYMTERLVGADDIARRLDGGGYRYFFVDVPAPKKGVRTDKGVPAPSRHVGYVAYCERTARDGVRELRLVGFHLMPRARGRGLAHDMARFVVRGARSADAARVRVNVCRDNRHAAEVFARLGFRQVGEARRDLGEGYVMDDLVFEYRLG